MRSRITLSSIIQALKDDWRRPACIVSSTLLGLALLFFVPRDSSLYTSSYDWLTRARFLFSTPIDIDDPVVLLVNESTVPDKARNIFQNKDRESLAVLITQLFTNYHPKTVIIDALLDEGEGNTNLDTAIANHNVFLVEIQTKDKGPDGAEIEGPKGPLPSFRAAASNRIGVVGEPVGRDGIIRLFSTNGEAIYRVLARTAGVTERMSGTRYWLNYYGPDSLQSRNISDVLMHTNASPDLTRFLSNKTVFIGSGKDVLTSKGSAADQHLTPWGKQDGAKILATMTRNFLKKEAIEELTPGSQRLSMLLFGLAMASAIALAGPWKQPRRGIIHVRYLARIMIVSIALAVSLISLASVSFYRGNIWMPWTVFGVPVMLALSWGFWMVLLPSRNKFEVFISYRRAGGDKLGRIVRRGLADYGIRAFLDTDDLQPGDYKEQLYGQLKLVSVVVLIVSEDLFSPSTPKDDFVLSEIQLALESNIVVLPFAVEGVKLPLTGLPESISKLGNQEAIVYVNHMAEESIAKLAKHVRYAAAL